MPSVGETGGICDKMRYTCNEETLPRVVVENEEDVRQLGDSKEGRLDN